MLSTGNGRFKTDLHQHQEHKSYAKYKTGKRIPNARNYIRGLMRRGKALGRRRQNPENSYT